MPALAEFLKGTVNEPLTKLVQPAGLVPAAVLVLWNLGFVLPRAKAEDVGIVETYYALDEAWQVTVAAVLILVVGYVLLNASGAVLDTLSGRTWRTSLLGALMMRLRGRRRQWLQDRVTAVEAVDDAQGLDIERPDTLRWRLRTRFSPEGEQAAPTSLGDVLRASEHGIRARYGVTLAALWEPLRAVVEKEDAAVTAATESKTTVDVMGNLTLVAVLILFEGVIVFTLFKDPDAVLVSLLAAPIAYVAYRVTVAKAISWCDAIDTVVALHAPDLFDKLGVKKPADGTARRAKLSRLSDFMLRDKGDDDLFGPEAAPEATVTVSPNLKVEVSDREERVPAGGGAAARQRLSIRYVAFVTRKAPEGAPTYAIGRLVISDDRLPRLREVPAEAEPVPAEKADQVDAMSWPVEVVGDGVTTLDFALDRWYVAVDSGCTVKVNTYRENGWFVEVHNPPNRPTVTPKVTVFHTEDGATHTVASSDVTLAPVPGKRSREVTLDPLDAGEYHDFSYSLEEKPA